MHRNTNEALDFATSRPNSATAKDKIPRLTAPAKDHRSRIEAESWESLGEGGTATERLTRFIIAYHTIIKRSIIKEKKLYDMVAVAMDEHWDVIQQHSYRMCDYICILLEKGMAAGEFRKMDGFKMAIATMQLWLFSCIHHCLNIG